MAVLAAPILMQPTGLGEAVLCWEVGARHVAKSRAGC